jgi:ribonuclease HI
MNIKYTIYTDGGSRGNPGPAAIGVILEGEDFGKKEYGEYIGVVTNNEAEYRAVIFGLKKLKQLIGNSKAEKANVVFQMDSELLVKQFNNEFKVKDENIQKLFLEVHNLRLDFGKVEFNHVLRGKNTAADKLVNQVLDREESKLNL